MDVQVAVPARGAGCIPQYKLTYDENGYCVKKEKCRIPDDIAAKLAEMNK